MAERDITKHPAWKIVEGLSYLGMLQGSAGAIRTLPRLNSPQSRDREMAELSSVGQNRVENSPNVEDTDADSAANADEDVEKKKKADGKSETEVEKKRRLSGSKMRTRWYDNCCNIL